MAEEKFKGAPYPINTHPRGYLRTQTGLNTIKSDLLILLLTNIGERVMLPEYGTPLKKLFFNPNDQDIIEEARSMIATSIQAWEPRVVVDQIDIQVGSSKSWEDSINEADAMQDLEHILGIRIALYDPEDIQSVQELVLEVPLA